MKRRGLLAAGLGLPGLLRAQELVGNLPAFHQALRARMDFSHGWRAGLDPVAWTRNGRAKARELMLLPGFAVDFAPRLLAEQDRGAYTARRVELNISRDSRAQALLLVPKAAGRHPAALMLHDHGARFDIGKEKLVRSWDDPPREASSAAWAQRYFSGRIPGEELARRGHVVLAIDALGWGQRSGEGFTAESQQALAANLLNLGSSWAGLIATEDARAADFLASLPEVDPARIAAVGFSMGALRAWQLAAVSERIAATVAVCWMGTHQGLMRPGGNQLKGQSAFAMLHPGLARALDYPDVAALAAPKPMLVYAGAKDPLFPLDAVEPAFAKMREVWAAYKRAGQLETRIWPDAAHEFNAAQQDAAFGWLERQLMT